jgi:hypothetical protein
MKTWSILLPGLSLAFTVIYPCAVAAEANVTDLLAAPLQLSIGERTLVLETYLWRDFMPISPPDGKPLIASLKLKTTNKTALPEGTEVETVWVVNGKKQWSPAKKEVRAGNDRSSMMTIVVRNGPKWGPGIKVDVVVRVKDAKGHSYLLRAAKQNINRTD